MKTKVFCLVLILIGAFTFSSCDDYVPDGPVTIEIVDGNCLILKQVPFDTVANVIFLEGISNTHSTSFFWKRKIAGEYKTITLSWTNYHSLNSGCAYFIMDTVNLPSLYMKFIDYRRQGVGDVHASNEKLCHEQLINAYLNPGKAKKIESKIVYHFNPLGIMITKADSGLTIKYNPVIKSFEKTTPIITEKTSFSIWPLIALLFFLIAATTLATPYSDEFEILGASFLVFTGVTVGISYFANLESMAGNIFFGIVIGVISVIIFRISVLFKGEKSQIISALILLGLINSALIWIITKQLTAAILSSGIIIVTYLVFLFILKYFAKIEIEKLKKDVIKKATEK